MDKNVNLIVKKLKKISCCEGIIYTGSRQEGDFTEDSDYDFTVLVSKGKSYYKTFRYKGLLVDICCATPDIIRKQDFTRDAVANAELGIIAHGEIVYDKSGRMNALQKQAKKIWALGPKNNPKEAGYLCTLFLHILNKPGSAQSYHSWNAIMEKIVRIFFELHKEWLPKSSNVGSRIKEIDKNFFKRYEKIYLSSAKDRARLTKQLIEYVVKKFHLPQTGEICFSKDENLSEA